MKFPPSMLESKSDYYNFDDLWVCLSDVNMQIMQGGPIQ